MKKIILLTLIVSSLLMGKQTLKEETEGWQLFFEIDDFNDKVSCHIVSKFDSNNKGIISIANINTKSDALMGYYSSSFIGKQLTYRIDKNEAKVLNRMLIKGEEYNKMIEVFKSGEILKIKVVPENRFANIGENTIPLSGFEKLYNLAKTCNYK